MPPPPGNPASAACIAMLVFDTEEENKLSYMEIYTAFREMADSLLELHLEEYGISAEQFAEVCKTMDQQATNEYRGTVAEIKATVAQALEAFAPHDAALKIVIGLAFQQFAEDRMPLPDALRRLEALVDAAPPEPEVAPTTPAAAPVAFTRERGSHRGLCVFVFAARNVTIAVIALTEAGLFTFGHPISHIRFSLGFKRWL